MRIVLGVAALGVVALLVGLLLASRSAKEPHAPPPAVAAPAPAPGPPSDPHDIAPPTPDTAGGGLPPANASPPPPPAAAPLDPPERIIHDHTGDVSPLVNPVAPVTVALIRRSAQPAVKACAASLIGREPPIKAHIFVTADVRAAAGKITIGHATLRSADALGADVEACIVKVFEQLTIDAPEGQGEGERQVYMPFNVP